MITGILTSRVRLIIGSGLSMVATDIASAKLSAMLVNAKIASMHATKMIATKVLAKATALWMLIMSIIVPIHQPQVIPVQKHAIHRVHHKVVTPVIVETPAEESGIVKPLFLHTFEKEYTCVFTGKITCGEGLCRSADVQVHVASEKNPNMMKTTTIQPDGSYEVSFFVKGSVHEHLDWWIVADSPDSASKQVQGREILMEDTHIHIEEPVSLL